MTATDRAWRRTLFCCGASGGLHVAIGAWIFLGFGSTQAVAPTVPAAQMVVELAALPSAPPVPPSLSPPRPEQKKAQPKPVVNAIDVPPLMKVKLDYRPEVAVPIVQNVRAKADPAQKPAEETTKAAAPDATRKEAAKAPEIGAPSASPPSKAQLSWESRVLAALERKKRYPGEAQRQGQEDIVYVRITIDPAGQVTESHIYRSKGFALLDGEVTSLIHRASPFPTPPSDLMKGRQVTTLSVPIEFFVNKVGAR